MFTLHLTSREGQERKNIYLYILYLSSFLPLSEKILADAADLVGSGFLKCSS